MANAFQSPGFQHGYGFQGGVVTPVAPTSRPAGGKAKKRRKSVVEIDGERFEVWSEAEAVHLFEQAQALAEQQAAQAAKSALNKARKKRRLTHAESLPTLEVAIPEIKAIGDEDIARMAAEYQKAIDTLYLTTARDAEIAYYIRRKQQEDEDDEETIEMLLLHG